jgi:hypothetical protein
VPVGEADLFITRQRAILAGENDYTTDTFHQITGRPSRPIAEFLQTTARNSSDAPVSCTIRSAARRPPWRRDHAPGRATHLPLCDGGALDGAAARAQTSPKMAGIGGQFAVVAGGLTGMSAYQRRGSPCGSVLSAGYKIMCSDGLRRRPGPRSAEKTL